MDRQKPEADGQRMADKAIKPQNIKLYLLKRDGSIVEVKDAQVGSTMLSQCKS